MSSNPYKRFSGVFMHGLQSSLCGDCKDHVDFLNGIRNFVQNNHGLQNQNVMYAVSISTEHLYFKSAVTCGAIYDWSRLHNHSTVLRFATTFGHFNHNVDKDNVAFLQFKKSDDGLWQSTVLGRKFFYNRKLKYDDVSNKKLIA